MDGLIKECVDMDEWKHSWHNEFKTLEDYENAKRVIEKKIHDRETQLMTLKKGLHLIDGIIDNEVKR